MLKDVVHRDVAVLALHNHVAHKVHRSVCAWIGNHLEVLQFHLERKCRSVAVAGVDSNGAHTGMERYAAVLACPGRQCAADEQKEHRAVEQQAWPAMPHLLLDDGVNDKASDQGQKDIKPPRAIDVRGGIFVVVEFFDDGAGGKHRNERHHNKQAKNIGFFHC